MKLDLPWFPKELMPNFKRSNHWTKYRAKTKKYREDCGWCAKAIKPESFDFTVTFYPPDNRKRDRDSIISAFKAGQDGLADAWGVNDNVFNITYAFGEVVKGGKVTLTLPTVGNMKG